jgi:hypothetical protein
MPKHHITVSLLIAALTFLVAVGEGAGLRCKDVDVGSLTGVAYPEMIVSVLTEIDSLTACTCEEKYTREGQPIQSFMDVRGALLPGDCAALRYFAKVQFVDWPLRAEQW